MCKIWMAKISLNRDLEGFNGFIGNGTRKNSSYQSNNLPYPIPTKKALKELRACFLPACCGIPTSTELSYMISGVNKSSDATSESFLVLYPVELLSGCCDCSFCFSRSISCLSLSFFFSFSS